MKYSCEIVIHQSRDKIVALFSNPENMKYWQKGLKSKELLSGEAGKQGAKTRLCYELGKRKVAMVETVMVVNPPEEFHSYYETKGVLNLQKNYFKEEGDSTRWISSSEYQCSGFIKIISFFWGEKIFKKQSEAYMEDFKAFAEGNPKYGK